MAQYVQLSATANIKRAGGRLCSLTVSSTSSGTITIYDSDALSTSVKVIDTLTPAANAHFFWGDEGLAIDDGIYVVIANTLSVTIGFK